MSIRTLKLSLGLVLCAASLQAQPAPMPVSSPAAGTVITEAKPLLPDVVEESRLLFYRVPAASLNAAQKSLMLRVSLGDRPFLEETFRLANDVTSPLSVELLARDPELLDRLYERARTSEKELTVTVLLNGKAVREFSFEDFLRYNRQLRKTDFHPVGVPSEVKSYFSPRKLPAPQSPLSPVAPKYYGPDRLCAQGCDDDFNYCYYDYCDQRGSCSYCYDYYNSCLASCPVVCEDPKKVENLTISEPVSSTFLGVGCYKAPSGGSYNYTQVQVTVKNTSVRRTTYCDGTVTNEYGYVWYTYTTCYQKGSSCFAPQGVMYNAC